MAEISGESDEVARNVITTRRALLQHARREGVAQIMDTRAPRSILTDASLRRITSKLHWTVRSDIGLASTDRNTWSSIPANRRRIAR